MPEETAQTTTEVEAKELPEAKAVVATGAEPKAKEAEASKPEPKYTDADLEQRIASVKGGYEGTLKKLKADIKAAQDEAKKAQEASEEAGYARFIKMAEEKGTDVDFAKNLVAAQKEGNQKAKQLKELEATLNEQLASLNEAGRVKKAEELVRDLKLDDKAKDELLKLGDPQVMETTALRLALQSRDVAQQPARKTDQARTPKGGRDFSKLSDTEKMGYALEQIGKA